jgi:sigma-B regulation protein RsbU (phosphoserine phosphatase)
MHEGVSRRHARVEFRTSSRIGTGKGTTSGAGRWFITDLDSAPGTFLNGVRLPPNLPSELAHADLLRIGPWTFRVGTDEDSSLSRFARTIDDTAGRVEPRSAAVSPQLANQRLDQLIDCTQRLMDAPDAAAMARVVLDAAISGTGFSRAALLSCPADPSQVEIQHTAGASDAEWRSTGGGLSRSLIAQAAAGAVASLTEQSTSAGLHTLAELRIHSALCAPVRVGQTVVSLLYLDARADESRVGVRTDAQSFCAALARVYGMAMGSAMRADLEHRRAALEGDLAAAREAQQMIMPPPDATLGRIAYAVRNVPGRFVAGDLFDAIELDNGAAGRAAFSIGDVSGHGAGSAILMASAQAYLHAALRRSGEPGEAFTELNGYVCRHASAGRFISAWAAVVDPAAMTLTYADAGHGHWLVRTADGGIDRTRRSGGIPLGVDPAYEYRPHTVPMRPDDRVLLFSDGVLEQQSPTGEQFGMERIVRLLAESTSAGGAADALLAAVQTHAGRPFLDDDTTIAVVEMQ